MKKIILLNNWGESPSKYLEHCRQQTPNSSLSWDNIIGVDNIKDADYYIILDDPPRDINLSMLDPEKIIFLQREPDHVKNYRRPIEAKHVYTYDNHLTYALWWIKKPFQELRDLKYPEKIKFNQNEQSVTCILTNKRITYGQRLRLDFAKKVSQTLKNRVHYYGNSLANEGFGSSFMGGLPLSGPPKRCKYDGLIPYSYSISLENGKLKNFCTRVWEPFLCWTMPIYWGCPNIEDFYPEDSYHTIDIERPDEAIKELADIIRRPITKRNIEAMRHARELVMHKYNIWAFLQEIINEHR